MGLIRKGFKLAAAMTGGYLGYLAAARREYDLAGKVVVITDGSRGLGLALAESFAARGCRVAICARDGIELERAADRLRERGAEVFFAVCDVTDRREVDAFLEEVHAAFGVVDVLVNNASIIQVGPLDVMREDDFRRAMDVNYWGTVNCTFAALPLLRRSKGRIVNITSIGGEVAIPHLLPYDTAKFAVRGFSEGLRAELQKDGVWVTTVVPGLMRTGSPVHAEFKGSPAKEFAWFVLGDALPFTSMNAKRAAERIVTACERGEAKVTLSWQAKLLRMAHALLPGTTLDVLGLVNRLLPRGGGQSDRGKRGLDIDSPFSILVERDAQRFNEYGGTQAPAEA
ncbi:MAG: SDR family NAD(P)-dependent oxidoreductase [Myxococcales bacterium]